MNYSLDSGWAIVGHSANDSIEQLYNKLSSHGIKPKEFMLYGDIRTFVRANELPETEAIAFHKGFYVGTVNMIDEYIEVTKRDEAYSSR